jgi:cell division protein FtsN
VRPAFFILLLLNAIFFAWAYFLADQDITLQNTPGRASNASESIHLLHEDQEPDSPPDKGTTKSKPNKSKSKNNRSDLRLLDELPEMAAGLADNQKGGTFEVGLNEQLESVAENLAKPVLSSANDVQSQPQVEAQNVAEMKTPVEARLEPEPQQIAAVPPSCFVLGPFDIRLNADRALTKLKEHGADSKMRTTEERDRLRYWIYAPTETLAAARKTIDKLKKKGIKDLYLIRDGEKKNAVSLGLYRSESSADKRLSKLKKLGFNPKIEKHYRIRNLYWLDVELTDGETLTPDQWLTVTGGFENLKSEQECK